VNTENSDAECESPELPAQCVLVRRASDRCNTVELQLKVFWKVFSQIQRLLIQQGLLKNCKTSEFFEKSPLSGAGKHPNFQVTACLQNDTTDVKFDD